MTSNLSSQLDMPSLLKLLRDQDKFHMGYARQAADEIERLQAMIRAGAYSIESADHLRDEIATLKRELSSRRWQPIETAPQDGTSLLGWWSHEEKVLHTHWLDNSKTAWPWCGWKAPSLQVSHPKAKPTHWMPLPVRPADEESGQ
jgi:hypothetical protein